MLITNLITLLTGVSVLLLIEEAECIFLFLYGILSLDGRFRNFARFIKWFKLKQALVRTIASCKSVIKHIT